MSDYTSSDTYELPDSFFDVTTNDCVAMQKDLQRQVKNLTDAPMMTAFHRQASQLAKYSHYETVCLLCLLRLPFSNCSSHFGSWVPNTQWTLWFVHLNFGVCSIRVSVYIGPFIKWWGSSIFWGCPFQDVVCAQFYSHSRLWFVFNFQTTGWCRDTSDPMSHVSTYCYYGDDILP